jgi:hypothetical protein
MQTHSKINQQGVENAVVKMAWSRDFVMQPVILYT